MQKYIWSISFLIFSLTSRVSAAFVFGQDSLIPCDGSSADPCGFPELMKLIDNLITFILEYLILPISVVIFIYGGFLYLTSGSNPNKRTQANKMFKNLGIGIFFCLAAWVIVKIVLTTFQYDDQTFSPVLGH